MSDTLIRLPVVLPPRAGLPTAAPNDANVAIIGANRIDIVRGSGLLGLSSFGFASRFWAGNLRATSGDADNSDAGNRGGGAF